MPAAKPIAAVLEDDPDAAEALGLVLRDWGAEVAVDVGPARLVKNLGERAREIAWIIADFDLGEQPDGIAAAKALTVLSPKARVLVLSGTFTGSGEAVAKAAGFDFLSKPATPEAIIRWLETAD